MALSRALALKLILACADQIQSFHSASQARRSSAGLVFNGRDLLP